MEIHQLRTFVAVAREGSITKASEQLYLSQPAVSAHIKAIEDSLGLPLFSRTARGMRLTSDGERLLALAEQTLRAHAGMLAEATRLKGELTGPFRLGSADSANPNAVGRLLASMATRCPAVTVTLRHGNSREVLDEIRSGDLDAGFYNESDAPSNDLITLPISGFGVYVVAPPGDNAPIDWATLAERTWIYPGPESCCARVAEELFQRHSIRPARVLRVDRGEVTRTLVANGVGVGLLHEDVAREAAAKGELVLLEEARQGVRLVFAHLASRANEPILRAVRELAAAQGNG